MEQSPPKNKVKERLLKIRRESLPDNNMESITEELQELIDQLEGKKDINN